MLENIQQGESYEGYDFHLTQSIEINESLFLPNGGDEQHPFKGNFYGDGNTITLLYVMLGDPADSSIGFENLGLFGVVENSHFENVSITFLDYCEFGAGAPCNAGVLAGKAKNSVFYNCSIIATPQYSNAQYCGVMVGYAENCEFDGCMVEISKAFSGYSYIGGMVGYAEGGSISRCSVSAFQVVAANDYAGGIVGYAKNVKIDYSSCTFSGVVLVKGFGNPGNTHSGDIAGYEEKEPTNWVEYVEQNLDAGYNWAGMGVEADPYQISSAVDLALLAKRVNDWETNPEWVDKYYVLTDDIMLAQYPWVPIGGDGAYPFSGNFDGQGHTIYGMNVDSDQDFAGLFSYCADTNIKNLNLKNGVVKSSGRPVGSLVGCCDSDVTIENVSSDVEVMMAEPKNLGDVGGLVGLGISNIQIKNCTFTGNVSGGENSFAGGLVGSLDDGLIQNCIVDGYVSGGMLAGALVGDNEGGTISNCIARGTVDGPGNILVGLNSGGSVSACYFYGSASDDTLVLDSKMTACYAVVNGRVITSGEVDSSWTDYWAVVPGLNGGLPVQKGLFWSAGVANSTAENIKRALGIE